MRDNQNNSPRNTPRPGPGSMPRKATPGSATPRPTVTVKPIESSPADFGRIDEDGTVWTREITGDGYREIGQWQAGDTASGLAHFGQRFDDLATEAATLEARLTSHPEEAAAIRTSAESLRDSLATATAIGDFAALDRQLGRISDQSHVVEEKAAQQQAQRREQALENKTALAAEAEDIAANSTQWREAGDRMKAIVEQWRGIRGLDKATDDELWRRFSAARDAFNKRRGAHFSELDKRRARARVVKEGLIERAEAIQNSTDWGATASEYRDLMNQWKKAGPAPRDVDDQLWARFRAAQDVFFGAREADQKERDKEFEANAEAKQKLIDEYADTIDPEANLDIAKQRLHELQDKWETIGFVPRGRVKEFEEKIGAVEAKVAEAEDAEWRRTDPETQARVAQFRDKADQLKADAEAAEKAGKSAQAAKLAAQAEQWSQWARTAAEAAQN